MNGIVQITRTDAPEVMAGPNIENTLQSALCALMDCDNRLNTIDGLLSPVATTVNAAMESPQGLIALSSQINDLAYRVAGRLNDLRDKLGN